MKKHFTLLELVIAVVIVAVLCVVGLADYRRTRSKVLAKDAAGQINMILQAELFYKAENNGTLLACNITYNCNTALGLQLNMQQGRRYCARINNPNPGNVCVSARTPANEYYSVNSATGVVYQGNCSPTCL